MTCVYVCTIPLKVSPSGHSPHHETPRTVNALLVKWLAHARHGGTPPLSGADDVLEMAVRVVPR